MNLLLVAKPGANNTYAVSIRSAHFGSQEQGAASVTAKDMPPPAYPEHAFREGATGVVYLLLKIGRDGKVEDLVAEQVNLTTLAQGVCRCRNRQSAALDICTAGSGRRGRCAVLGHAGAGHVRHPSLAR